MERKITPYSYQEVGIKKGLELKRFINGDDMGLGKTMQALITIETAEATPALIICPSSLKINWERETKKVTGLRPLILTDSVKSTFPYFIGSMNMYDVVICNYESLKKYFVVSAPKGFKLKDVIFQPVIRQFKSVVFDESHKVKDPSSQQTKFAKGIASGKEYVMMLTGTPVVNTPADIATQIAIIGKINEFGGYGQFMHDFGGGDNLGRLQTLIKERCYFRREKKEVFKDMPPLTRTTLVCELDPVSREEYDTCREDLKKYLQEYKGCSDTEIKKKMRMQALVKFMNLRHITGSGKVNAAIEFIKNVGRNIIVFCSHHDIVDKLKAVFPEAVTVTGRDSQQQKQWAIDSFQSRKANIIICSIKAAGVGLTLTASSYELFIEQPWTYADLSQCECRAYRIGQTEAVNSYVAIGEDTIDDKLYQLIMDKRSIASQITGSDDEVPTDERYFNELMSCLT